MSVNTTNPQNISVNTILQKLGISELNEMQEEASLAISSAEEVIILSPTGTGKTLAFLLPVMSALKKEIHGVQVLILAPSRELAMQIEQVARAMGTGYKINCVYGGKSFSKDKIELKVAPSLLIGTPGRIADHLRRGTISATNIHTVVIDEYDKSLEIGFEGEMSEILEILPSKIKKILTSATKGNVQPHFLHLDKPQVINYLDDGLPKLTVKSIISPEKDKLNTLLKAICHFGDQSGIVFCNYKESIERISDFLKHNGIDHGIYYGGMEQIDREQELVKFRNGSHKILVATDLAARGLDVPELDYILHYHLPLKYHEFTHRNGRTARMHKGGTAYVLHWVDEELPAFIGNVKEEVLTDQDLPEKSEWSTILISGGRRDKISKRDIVGFFVKQGHVDAGDIGQIEIHHDWSFVAVKNHQVDHAIEQLDKEKLKTKKVKLKVV